MPKATPEQIANNFTLSKKYKRDLVYHKTFNCFYVWQQGYYKRLEDREFKKLLISYIQEKYPDKAISSQLIVEVQKLISWYIIREETEESTTHIALKDALVNLKTFEIEEFDHEKFITFHLDYATTDFDVPIPHWKKYLATTFVQEKDTSQPDEELIHLVQEMMGYFLIDDMKGSAAFFLVGEGSNGKSKLLEVVRTMFNEEYVSAMTIADMSSDRFATASLVGKRINITAEDESKFMKSSLFKALVSGDLINARQIYGENFSFIPKAKYVFATNELPTFDSINYGLMRRIFIIPFYRKFRPTDPDRDPDLFEKLRLEIPGIVKWAILGAKRLITNGYVFSKASATAKEMLKFENEISSSLRFVREHYEVNDNFFITNTELYKAYQLWCNETNRRAVADSRFFKEIMAHITDMQSVVKYIQGEEQRGKNLVRLRGSMLHVDNLDNIAFNQ